MDLNGLSLSLAHPRTTVAARSDTDSAGGLTGCGKLGQSGKIGKKQRGATSLSARGVFCTTSVTFAQPRTSGPSESCPIVHLTSSGATAAVSELYDYIVDSYWQILIRRFSAGLHKTVILRIESRALSATSRPNLIFSL